MILTLSSFKMVVFECMEMTVLNISMGETLVGCPHIGEVKEYFFFNWVRLWLSSVQETLVIKTDFSTIIWDKPGIVTS